MPAFPPVPEQMDEIRRDALEIVPEEELARKLERSRRTGAPLVVKQGFDPTRPDLHLGHAVSLRKLRTFQELGHDVVFVLGDYTARVGDPSGRSETRPRLSPEEIDANARTYEQQVGILLDLERCRIEPNSRWLAPLDMAGILQLTGTYTVSRMLERDDFAQRFAAQRPISIMEFMYPLMQAYDSVALKADVELGGTDQKFNLLVARTVQERYGQEPQVCLIMPLMRGTDGDLKMSKSYDNYVGITESAEQQYGKTMSIPDSLLEEWYHLATPLRGAALESALAGVRSDPYRAKRELARIVTATYHGDVAAEAAAAGFDALFKRHEVPEEMPELELPLATPALRHDPARGVWAPGLFVAGGLAASNGEAQRLAEQGALSIDGERVDDRGAYVPVRPGDTLVLKRGKRQFLRVHLRA